MFEYSNIHYTESYYIELGYYIHGNGKYKQQHILLFSTHYCLLCSEEFRARNSHWIIWSGFLQHQTMSILSLTKALARHNNLAMLLTQPYISFTSLFIINQNKGMCLLLDYFTVRSEGTEKKKGSGHKHNQNTLISPGCHAASCVDRTSTSEQATERWNYINQHWNGRTFHLHPSRSIIYSSSVNRNIIGRCSTPS